MYNYYTLRGILLQASANGGSQFSRQSQQKMNDLFHGYEFTCAYIDDILIITRVDWPNHIQYLELTINKLKGKGLKYNIEKYFFGKTEMEYLGLWVTCNSNP